MTIGEKLERSGGVAPGFDFMRVALAFCVVAAHSIWVVDPKSSLGLTRLSWFPFYTVMPAFFALSGFLVASSAERLRLRDFAINRALRMMPALGVEIVLSAFILGAVFTALPVRDYLLNAGTWRYLTNVVGLINFHLPGVFMVLPIRGVVNTSLWSIPWEYAVYAVIGVLMVTGGIKRVYPITLVVGAYVIGAVLEQGFHLEYGPSLSAAIIRVVFNGDGSRLLLPALFGIAGYKLRRHLPYSWAGVGVALAWCLAVACLAPLRWIYDPAMAVLTSAPLAYLTLVLGVTEMPKLPFFHRGDYSYGIYLYGFPIQQAIKQILPGISDPLVLTAIAFPIITLFAVFSWSCIEKPVLKLRKKFSFVARLRLRPDEMAAATGLQAPAAAKALPASALRRFSSTAP